MNSLNFSKKKKDGYFKGTIIAILELSMFFYISYFFRQHNLGLLSMDIVSYFWLQFTILTFIWETSYIINYKLTLKSANNLILNKETVWNNYYNLSYLLPHKLAVIFYADYAAYADREYMSKKDDWSKVIEGTHAYLCGIFALFSIYFKIYETQLNNYHDYFLITANLSMGTQLMNSILYISNYLIQCETKTSVNYNSRYFPTGYLLLNRPFIYINVFWTIMPIYVITRFFI